MIERTLVLIKPDGVVRGLIGDCISRLEHRGLKIVGMKMIWVDEKFAQEHYKAHASKPFFKSLVQFIIEGPIVAMAIEGINAVQVVRKIVGSTSPHDAPVGTIRGDFSHLSLDYANKKGIGGKNLIHASGTSEEAKEEMALWFKENDIHSYKTSYEEHIEK